MIEKNLRRIAALLLLLAASLTATADEPSWKWVVS
jgi:hypothetical protein